MPFRFANPRFTGSLHEARACRYLQQQGLVLVYRNYLCKVGELDLVMCEQDRMLVFVEIRFRREASFGSALATVTAQKQRKIRRAAAHFLLNNPAWAQHACRFDVVGVQRDKNTGKLQFDWIKAAFF